VHGEGGRRDADPDLGSAMEKKGFGS